MYTHIVLISNRNAPMDDKHWVRCESEERAKTVARNYRRNNDFYVEIYSLGEEIDF